MKLFKRIMVIMLMSSFFIFMPIAHAETGIIGEYDTIEEATEVANQSKVDNDKEKIDTNITIKQEEYISDTQSLDETYNTEEEAISEVEAYKESCINNGYEEESSNIETVDVEEKENETKDFNSISDIFSYRDQLEAAGYTVDMNLSNISFTTKETDRTSVDKTFTNAIDALTYTLTLALNYNNLELQFEDNSYNVVTKDEDVSQSFSTEQEAIDYLIALANQYTLTNNNIEYQEVPAQDVEHIKEYYESEEAAENAYNNMQSSDYSLENKEIKKLTESEIKNNKNDVINGLSLNNDNERYVGIHGNSTNVDVTITDRNGNKINSSGIAIITSIVVNNNSHTAVSGISLFSLPNNSVARVRGTITYCSSYRTIAGIRICRGYSTDTFESYGLVNTDRNSNSAILTDNVFYYSLDKYDASNKNVTDNLVHAYTLDVDKVTGYTIPTYTASGHIHSEDTINQYRVYGDVSRISIVPVYTMNITKTRTVQKYHAVTKMIKKDTKDVYVVNYTKTIKENPVKTNNPKTGDNIIIYFISLIILSLGLGISLYKNKKLD